MSDVYFRFTDDGSVVTFAMMSKSFEREMLKKIHQPMRSKTMDNWKHRSENMKCKTCMWFVNKEPALSGIGRCRRHAPTMIGYPAVYQTDWCGDHKIDEKANLGGNELGKIQQVDYDPSN